MRRTASGREKREKQEKQEKLEMRESGGVEGVKREAAGNESRIRGKESRPIGGIYLQEDNSRILADNAGEAG